MSAGFLLPIVERWTSTSRLYEEFPAYSSVLLRLAMNLRTVIVTAAVHRGFGSELRLAANPSP